LTVLIPRSDKRKPIIDDYQFVKQNQDDSMVLPSAKSKMTEKADLDNSRLTTS